GSRNNGRWSRRTDEKITSDTTIKRLCRLRYEDIPASPSTGAFAQLATLVDRSSGVHPGIKLDFPKGILVLHDVLLQNGKQGLGLLRADIHSLKIRDLDLRLAVLLQGSKHQKKIPDIHPDLNAVGIVFAVGGGVRQL